MTKRFPLHPSVTRSWTKKDGIGYCQILLLSFLLSFPMTQSRANRKRRQGLCGAERPIRTVIWFYQDESKTVLLKPTWKSERLHVVKKTIRTLEEGDIGPQRKRKDVHNSQPVKYKPASLTRTPSVFKCLVDGFLGRWELAGFLGLGILPRASSIL